ncbi:unnamed protein product [Sphagnum tenellum]
MNRGSGTIVVVLANRPLGVWWLYSWKMVLTVVAQQFGSTQILGFSEIPHSTSCSTAKPTIFHFVGVHASYGASGFFFQQAKKV